MAVRRVVLLCGPPGVGKSTLAMGMGLDVYDSDLEPFAGDQVLFNLACARVGDDPQARAVVIRSGATRSARARAAELIGATEVRLLLVDPDECVRRVRARGRGNVNGQVAGVRKWFAEFEPEPLRSRVL